MKINKRITEVLKWLEAYSSGFSKQDVEAMESFYNVALTQLDTGQQAAFHTGALAVSAMVAGYRIRGWWYTRKFKQAIENLKEND